MKDIKGYEGLYAVTSCGKVWSYRRNKFLKVRDKGDGYKKVTLTDRNGKAMDRSIHRLVANAYIPNPNNLPEVNHKNEDRAKNNVQNLEWCTRQYNITYGTRASKFIKALGVEVVCLETGIIYESASAAGRALNIHISAITRAIRCPNYTANGYHWALLEDYQKDTFKNKYYNNKPKCTCTKPIICHETGTVYDSIAAAARALNLKNQSCISVALDNTNRTAGGYHWSTTKICN